MQKKCSDYYLKCSRIFLEDEIVFDKYIRITKGIIAGISDTPTAKINVIDMAKNSLLPGFLDLHVHGREGYDVMDSTKEALNAISNSLIKYGVVGFLATTVTSTWENTLDAFANIGDVYNNQPDGAILLGAYNEGLFFTKDHKGAHDEKYFLPLDRSVIDEIIDVSNGALKVIALAPELDNSSDLISYLKKNGVRTMLGHTNANYQETCDALKAGACGGVHIFNGMSGIHHRDPGCAGAILLDREAYVEVIADGVHLHPSILELIYRLKEPEKIGLISDCIVAGGMIDGTYKLGMLDVIVDKGIARTASGSLAGSTLTLDRAIKNMIELANIPVQLAVNMASLYPAKFLGIDDQLGSIFPKKRACLTLVDNDYNVTGTIVDGKLVYANVELKSKFQECNVDFS